jgi:hypothetical protein
MNVKIDARTQAELLAIQAMTPDTAVRKQLRDPFDRMGAATGLGDAANTSADRKLVREATLAQVVASGGVGNATAGFRVQNPSPRVRVKVVVSFWADQPVEAVPSITGSSVSIVPWEPDANGNEAPADSVVSSEALPYAYEAETSAESLRGTVALTSGTSLTGYFKVVASWEPAEDMSDARWLALQSRCAVANITGRVIALAAGGAP